jgi:SAM-dependent methyltransferase
VSGDLLERIGACPRCRGALARETRAYVCASCRTRWPVVGGIPRFVDSQHYVGSFGWQWRRHRRTQIDSAVRVESEHTFAEKTGLRPEDVRGKVVLDVGVGTGRFSDVVARWGGIPVGVDLSLAVLSARRNLATDALVAQADLFALPFREDAFDHVFSIGVLHHTPSTRDAFRAIARHAKPGGTVAIAVYEDHPTFYRYSTRYRRATSEMSHPLLHLLSHAAVPLWHVEQAAKTLFGPFGPHVAGRLRTAFPIRDHADPLWRVLDTFDWYSPRFQWKHDEREVRRWFEELGFSDVRRMPETTMVSVRGTRGPGPLATPPPSEERRSGALAPLPRWIPSGGALRDAALVALLAGEAAKAAGELGVQLARETAEKALGGGSRVVSSEPRR